MQVSITGRHVELTPPLKSYVEEKLQHLKHSFDQVVDVHVVLSVEKNRQYAEVSIQACGVTIHGKEETEDMYASIDGVVDKLNRQLKRYRAKMQHHHKRGRIRNVDTQLSHRVLATPNTTEEISVDYTPEVLHLEQMAAKPMSVDEAVMQMELSSKESVFVFTNQDTHHMNVLYRRDDGRFSWIEPQQT